MRLTKEQREARDREQWQIRILNHLFDHREAVQQYSTEQKKAVVLEFVRYGCSTVDIQKASGFSLAFVNDVIRDFAHQCLVEKARTNVQV
jgi:hypothetical protein